MSKKQADEGQPTKLATVRWVERVIIDGDISRHDRRLQVLDENNEYVDVETIQE